MTITRLSEEMTMREYLSWVTFDNQRNEQREKATKKKPGKKNMMSSPEAMLEGFGIGNDANKKEKGL